MSMAAPHAVRAVAGGGSISTGTLALLGLGTFCLANPEKALHLLQRVLLTMSSDGGDSSSSSNRMSNHAPQPIVIHAGGSSSGGGAGGRGLYAIVLQLSVGAGLCWGSYALLVNILPEQAKNMLPVTQGTFKAAVTSLGKGLLHVKDTLSAEISALLAQQSELSHKQDETHEQVLYVQDQVSDVHDDLQVMQNSLDDCHAALQSTDKRTTYIARGIRLVTQGMTAMLPPDDELVQELRSFQKSTAHEGSSMIRNKPEGETRRAARGDAASRSSGSHRSVRRGREGRSRSSKNKPADYGSPSSDTLSVSTGTPVRNVVIPAAAARNNNKNKKVASGDDEDSVITTANPELKELEDVRKLLLSMDQRSRMNAL